MQDLLHSREIRVSKHGPWKSLLRKGSPLKDQIPRRRHSPPCRCWCDSVSLSFPFMVRFPVQKSQEGRIRRVAGPLSCSKHVVLPLMSDDVKKVTLFVDAGGNMRLETILKGWGSYDKDRDHYAFRRFANRNPDTHKYHFSDTLKG